MFSAIAINPADLDQSITYRENRGYFVKLEGLSRGPYPTIQRAAKALEAWISEEFAL